MVRKPKGKRPLGRPKSRQEDNIKMDLRDIQLESVECTHLAQERDLWQAPVNIK
jgi:hypothetical protein